MKKIANAALGAARLLSILLLLILGFTALVGGAALIVDPSGSAMGMGIALLQGTYFSDFSVPGLILFVALGVGGISAAVLSIMRHPYYPLLVLYQGIILTLWIIVQIYLLAQLHTLLVIYGFIGLALILLGNYLRLKSNDRINTIY